MAVKIPDDKGIKELFPEYSKQLVANQTQQRPTANGGIETINTPLMMSPTRKPAETYEDTKYNFDFTPTKFKTILDDYYKNSDPGLFNQIVNYMKNYDTDLESDLKRLQNNEYDNLTRNKLYKKYLEVGGMMNELGTKTNKQHIIDFSRKFNRKAEPLYAQDPEIEKVYEWLESQGTSRDSEIANGLTPENIKFITTLINSKKGK